MLKLLSFTFSGIGRFVEEQTVDFTKLGNLVQVDAENKNTSGSSGSGKSTLFHALEYNLGINDIPVSILQSRLTKDGISTIGQYDLDGKSLVITRSKSKFAIELDGETISGSSKITEEKLDQILAMPRHLFRSTLHKRQKEGGFFLQLTPKEIHEFLTDCLGLGDLRKKQELVDKKLKELAEKKSSTVSALDSAKVGQKATQDAVAALGKAPAKDIHKEVILTLKAKLEASQANLTNVQTSHRLESEALELTRPTLRDTSPDTSVRIALQAELSALRGMERELNESHAQLIKEETNRVAAVNSEISKLQLKCSELNNNIRNGNYVKTEAASAALEIKKIRESICPTCEQGWLTDTAKAKELQLLDKLKKFREMILLGDQSAQELAQLTVTIGSLKEQATAKEIPLDPQFQIIEAKLTELTSKINEEQVREKDFANAQHYLNQISLKAFSAEQAKLLERHTAELNQARGQLDLDRRTFEASAQKLKSYEDARVRYETQLKTLTDNGQYYDQKVAELSNILTITDEELTVAEEVKRAIKSYASCSFDDALSYIGDVASRIIRAIPNMANTTIQLEGIKETKEGKLKEEVNAVISSDGEIGIPIKSLSGGERSSVDLAVDLAVIDLIENKTGKGIDTFILDEPFTGLDTVSIEMALEVLKNSNLNKRLVIVDHNPEAKQMVESRLVVVRDGATSTVVQQ